MVGHTHEDADQMFLRMSVHIARKSVRTLPILLDLAREAYHSMPNVQRLDNIWDYRQMEMSSKVQPRSPHQFKFVKEGEKCWCISRNGLSSPQHIRSLTSPALPLLIKMSQSKSSRLQKRKEGFWSQEWRPKEMARWRENDRGPDKMVEGPSSKGDRISIAFSKKGQPVSTL